MAADEVAATSAEAAELEGGGLLHEIVTSPLNLLLLGLCVFLLYKIVRGDQAAAGDGDDDDPPQLPRLKRRDFTPAELRRFDGVQDPRILMAINGKVFDVTKGRKFYGPGTAEPPPLPGGAPGGGNMEASREGAQGGAGGNASVSRGPRGGEGAGAPGRGGLQGEACDAGEPGGARARVFRGAGSRDVQRRACALRAGGARARERGASIGMCAR